jgi:hypothetical protein
VAIVAIVELIFLQALVETQKKVLPFKGKKSMPVFHRVPCLSARDAGEQSGSGCGDREPALPAIGARPATDEV